MKFSKIEYGSINKIVEGENRCLGIYKKQSNASTFQLKQRVSRHIGAAHKQPCTRKLVQYIGEGGGMGRFLRTSIDAQRRDIYNIVFFN